jgi:hypothetical protein
VALTTLLERGKTLVEGAGAVPLAALLFEAFGYDDEETIVPALCGGNIDMNTLTTVLIRGLVETGRYLRIRMVLVDRPGALEELTDVIASHRANIYAIQHDRTSRDVAMDDAEVEIELRARPYRSDPDGPHVRALKRNADAIIGAGALTTGLKAYFGLPRPPAAVHVIPADGYGFPSGHAVAATITWLTIAVHASSSTRQRRIAAALVIIGLVGLSRVILGVHYPIDVAAGILAGLIYLAITAAGSWNAPEWSLGLALVTSLLALVIARTPDAVFYASVAVASTLTWRTWSIPDEPTGKTTHRLALPAGLLIAAAGITYEPPVESLVAGVVSWLLPFGLAVGPDATGFGARAVLVLGAPDGVLELVGVLDTGALDSVGTDPQMIEQTR